MEHDITYIDPNEEVRCPFENGVKVEVPFVGIYNSVLDADIENSIERELENMEGDKQVLVSVDLSAIYRSIADATIAICGFNKATYAGCISPQFYNYSDDRIFIWVDKDELESARVDDDEENTETIMNLLWDAYDEDVISVDLDEAVGIAAWHHFALGIYDAWMDGNIRGTYYNGDEVIYENLKIEENEPTTEDEV